MVSDISLYSKGLGFEFCSNLSGLVWSFCKVSTSGRNGAELQTISKGLQSFLGNLSNIVILDEGVQATRIEVPCHIPLLDDSLSD